MALDRRSLLALGVAAGFAPAASRAQPAIPDKAVRLLLGAGTGGGIDQVARLIAPQLERRTGRHFTIEYRSGSTGATAAEALKTGQADGSHLSLMPSTMIPALLAPKDATFDPLVDLAPISLVGSFPLALAVSPGIGVATLAEYSAWLKEDPQRTTLGTAAMSDASIQLFSKMLGQQLGTIPNMVALRNPSAMMTDLESGRLPAAVAAVPTLLTAHRGGRLRILMVTGGKPLKSAPKLPTASELGLKDFELREWYGFFTAGKVPRPTVDAWNVHIRDVLDDSGLKGELTQLGLDIETSTPEEARQRVVAQVEFWKAGMGLPAAKPKD